LVGKVRGHHDLPHVRVGSMAQSQTLNWLTERGIAPVPFLTERDGLQAIVDNQIDAEFDLFTMVLDGGPG